VPADIMINKSLPYSIRHAMI